MECTYGEIIAAMLADGISINEAQEWADMVEGD